MFVLLLFSFQFLLGISWWKSKSQTFTDTKPPLVSLWNIVVSINSCGTVALMIFFVTLELRISPVWKLTESRPKLESHIWITWSPEKKTIFYKCYGFVFNLESKCEMMEKVGMLHEKGVGRLEKWDGSTEWIHVHLPLVRKWRETGEIGRENWVTPLSIPFPDKLLFSFKTH